MKRGIFDSSSQSSSLRMTSHQPRDDNVGDKKPSPRSDDMTDGKDQDTPAIYQIRVKGILDLSWSDWFDKFSITTQDNETTLVGPVSDQAALHGILTKINDLGLTLISVSQIHSGQLTF
jgi:hypothetical protein